MEGIPPAHNLQVYMTRLSRAMDIRSFLGRQSLKGRNIPPSAVVEKTLMKYSPDNLPNQVVQMLESIRTDNRSGAAELLERAAAVYAAAAASHPEPTPETAFLIVDSISLALRNAQPGMAGILNLIGKVEAAIQR